MCLCSLNKAFDFLLLGGERFFHYKHLFGGGAPCWVGKNDTILPLTMTHFRKISLGVQSYRPETLTAEKQFKQILTKP